MNKGIGISLLSLALLAAASAAPAATITVTIGSSDPIDINPQTGRISDLPGPDGRVSFSEAMIAANNTPGFDTIGFQIPPSDWTFLWLYPGRAVVRTTNDFYWRAYEAVTIDGTTQTAFTGDTNPDGAEVVLMSGHPYLNADGCTVLGLDSSSISFTRSNGLATDNTGTMSLELFGGSGTTIRRNTGGTLKIDRSSNNVVVGNTFQRVRVLGWIAGGQPAVDNRIGGPNPEDRNTIIGLGTWNSEGYPNGFAVQLFNAIGTIVENNSVGTTPDGMAQGNNATIMGIWLDSENHDTVIRNNRIAGILGRGIGPHFFGVVGYAIYIGGTGSGIAIAGNTIGLNANGEAVLGSVTGIDAGTSYYPSPPTDIRIGGTGPGEGNVIAGHLFNGITVGRDMPQVRIAGNSIYANHDLAIDLVTAANGYGVTLNDPLDTDSGGNGLQNFPEIASATSQGGTLRIVGALHSSAANQFTIDFFSSPDCDGSGFGESARYLGSTAVSTDGAGDASFDVVLQTTVSAGSVVTSTATREPLGATSELSACVTVNGVTAAPPSESGAAVASLRLFPSYPNPLRNQSTIRFELPSEEIVRLTIHDATGRLVRVLSNARCPVGVHSVLWDGKSESGQLVAGGIYFCEIRAGEARATKRIVVVR